MGAASLAASNIAPQAFNFLATPVLARLYTPSDFGFFQFAFGVSSVVILFLTLTLNHAIIVSKTNSAATNLFRALSLFTIKTGAGLLVTTILYVVLYDSNSTLPVLIALLSLVSGLGTYVSATFIRLNFFKLNGKYVALRTLGTVGAQYSASFILPNGYGLICGVIFGEFVALAFATFLLYPRSKWSNERTKALKLSSLQRFITYFFPSQLLALGVNLIPIAVLKYTGGQEVLGIFSIGMRLIATPANSIALGIKPLFWRWCLTQRNTPQNISLAFLATSYLSGCLVALIYYANELTLVATFLGPQWEKIDAFIPLFIAWISSSIGNLFPFEVLKNTEHQKDILFIEAVISILKIAFMAYAIIFELKPVDILTLWLAGSFMANLIGAILSMRKVYVYK